MEIDHISYIFGSFTRRRQSQDVNNMIKRRSIEQAKINHDRSKSTPHTTSAQPANGIKKKSDLLLLSRAKSVCSTNTNYNNNNNRAKDGETDYKCTICGKYFVEPRVLPCLHTFCTRCLQNIESQRYSSLYSLNNREIDCGSSTTGATWKSVAIACPTCGETTECPPNGVVDFPPNYMVQHRMVLATLNSRTTKLLCDFCPNDIGATHRCTECAANLCSDCYEAHRKRQKFGSAHEILTLDEARRRGITRVRRQIMCTNHPDRELTVFCSNCCQVVCRDCLSSDHKGHTCEPVARAVKMQITNLRLALAKTKSFSEMAQLNATCRYQSGTKQIETQCNQIQMEVEKFIKSYKQSIDEHRKELIRQIREIREEKLKVLNEQREELLRKSKEAKQILEFVGDLLDDGTDVEILNFVKPLLNRMEICNKTDSALDAKALDSLQFIADEIATNGSEKDECNCPVYGVLTTQTVFPKNCTIDTTNLQNVRVGKCVEINLEIKDRNNARLQRGGQTVTAELRYKEINSSRSLHVSVEDLRDGTYKLRFVPDAPGKLHLAVYVKGQPIKDNPFPVVVRSLRPHHGIYHCCSFCSSGGCKEASCGCGGTMPGGYKGCGHGHDGHPGKRHWSCCGNPMEHSECVRANASHYQFTL